MGQWGGMCTKEAFRRARTLVSNLLCPLQLLSNSRLGRADRGILRRTGAPPQGALRKCELRNTPAPAAGSKKGGRSRPAPISPSGHPVADNMAVTD